MSGDLGVALVIPVPILTVYFGVIVVRLLKSFENGYRLASSVVILSAGVFAFSLLYGLSVALALGSVGSNIASHQYVQLKLYFALLITASLISGITFIAGQSVRRGWST